MSSALPPDSPWDPAYPIAKNQNPATITSSEVLAMLREGKQAGKDFVLVDLRREDRTGGTIRGSINLPAQSLYHAIPTLYTMFAAAKLASVIWYCGSSQHRGLRAAAWMDDHIKDRGDSNLRSLVLLGGIKGWVDAGTEYTAFVDEYDEGSWR